MQSIDPVTAYKAGNSREAQLVLQLLEEEGIEARVASNGVEFIAGELPYQVASCPVLVHRADLERASEVIARYEETLCGDRKPWVSEDEKYCYHCGESVEPGAASCPACRRTLEWPASQEDDEPDAPSNYRRWLRVFVLFIGCLLFLTSTAAAILVIAVVVVEMIMSYGSAPSKKLSNR